MNMEGAAPASAARPTWIRSRGKGVRVRVRVRVARHAP